MTIDVNSQEFKDAVQVAVDSATEGLARKNSELLGEVKKLKRGAEIDPAEVTALENQIDALKADLTKAQKEAKTFASKADEFGKALESESGFTRSLLIEQGLTAELVNAGVKNPAHLKAALAMLKGDAQVVQDGDKRVAKIGDKALKDYVKAWAAGDDGKHFITADQNSGGGAFGGGSGSGALPTMTRAAFESLNPVAKASAMKAGTTLTET
jgi:hypothetical protein